VVWKADVGRRNFFTVHDVHRDAPRCQAARAQASYLVVASATSRLIREQTIEQKVCLHTPHATRPSRLVGLTRLYNLRSLTPFSDHGRLSPNIQTRHPFSQPCRTAWVSFFAPSPWREVLTLAAGTKSMFLSIGLFES